MNQVAAFIRGMFLENVVFKTVAFILTLSLFIWVRDDREASVVAYAPVRMVIPEGMELTSPPVDRVRLTVRGRWSDINTFDPTSVEPILVEASMEASQLIPLTSEMIALPPGLIPTTIQPDVLRIELESLETKTVPIRVRIVGSPRDNFQLGDATVSPATIEFKGPQSSIARLEFVATEPVDVSGITEPVEREIQLRPEDPLVSYDRNTAITVKIPVETVEVRRTLQDIGIIVVNSTRELEVRPARLSATVRGPKAAVDSIDPGALHATVDMKDVDPNAVVTNYERQPVLKNLPPDVVLEEFYPRDVLITPKRTPIP